MAVDITTTWVQGQDLDVLLNYKEGPNADNMTVIDLSTDYSVRMDLVDSTTLQRLYTFNSEDIADVDVGAPTTPDTNTEAVLGTGLSGPNIDISVSRSLTLPGGELYTAITAVPPKLTFLGDIFLRHKSANKQWKIAKLTITIEKSYTLWL